MNDPTLQDIQERFQHDEIYGLDSKDIEYLLETLQQLDLYTEVVAELVDEELFQTIEAEFIERKEDELGIL